MHRALPHGVTVAHRIHPLKVPFGNMALGDCGMPIKNAGEGFSPTCLAGESEVNFSVLCFCAACLGCMVSFSQPNENHFTYFFSLTEDDLFL